MGNRWFTPGVPLDRRTLLVLGLLPAVATVGAMAIAFAAVWGVLSAWEGILLGSFWSRILALAVMYLLPQFVVGLWMGARHGLSIVPPIAAGLAPVAVLILALGLFGGPMSMPFETPALTAAAVAVWSTTCACGLFVGRKVLTTRLAKPGLAARVSFTRRRRYD